MNHGCDVFVEAHLKQTDGMPGSADHGEIGGKRMSRSEPWDKVFSAVFLRIHIKEDSSETMVGITEYDLRSLC